MTRWHRLFLVFCLSLPLPAQADSDDPGRKQFNKCAACHSLEKGAHLAGPSLYGLFGRQAGSIDGFIFSLAMEQAGIVWTPESLSTFLENPMQKVPGTSMAFGGIRKAEQRSALIDYLQRIAN